MASIKLNAGYNSPELAAAAQNIASMFGPPPASDLAAYSVAAKNRQEAEQRAQLFAAGMTPSEQAALVGIQDYGQTPQGFIYKVDQDNSTQRYGYDTQATTSRLNNADTNRTDLIMEMFGPRDPYHTQPALPATIADSFGLPEIPAMQGQPKPLSQTEVLGGQTLRLIEGGQIGDDDLKTLIMKGTEGTAAEDRIARIAQNLQATGDVVDPIEAHNLAVGIVDGRFRESRHPVTGEVVIIDMATGQPAYQPRPSAVGGSGDPVIDAVVRADPSARFGAPYPAPRESFGVGGAAAGAINTITDTLGMGPAYPEIQQSQADFNMLQESLLNDLESAYGGRVPSWLLQELRKLTPAAGSLFEGPDQAQAKLTAMGRQLSNQLNLAQQGLGGELTPTRRQDLESQLSGLQAAVARVNQALSALGGAGGPREAPVAVPGAPDADGWMTLPNGVRIREVQ